MNDQILNYCNKEVYEGKLRNANDSCKNKRLAVDMSKLRTM
jgi:hypothetical protein